MARGVKTQPQATISVEDLEAAVWFITGLRDPSLVRRVVAVACEFAWSHGAHLPPDGEAEAARVRSHAGLTLADLVDSSSSKGPVDEAMRVALRGEKRCNRCGLIKPVEGGFHRDRRDRSGYRSACSACESKRRTQRNDAAAEAASGAASSVEKPRCCR